MVVAMVVAMVVVMWGRRRRKARYSMVCEGEKVQQQEGLNLYHLVLGAKEDLADVGVEGSGCLLAAARPFTFTPEYQVIMNEKITPIINMPLLEHLQYSPL